MPSIDVLDLNRNKVGSLNLSDDLFGEVGNTHVVWEVVRHHLAARRRGTHATKTRADVRGGGKKPWRQKGTGRARVGSARNPLWRHGGIAMGPQPRDYDFHMPRRKKRVAVCRVIASMLGNDRITILDGLAVADPRTRTLKGILGGLGLQDGKTLLLVASVEPNLERASRNLQEVKVASPESVNAYDLLRYRRLVATRDAMSRLQEVLGQ
jgi:large subunit ribosomal protein L4